MGAEVIRREREEKRWVVESEEEDVGVVLRDRSGRRKAVKCQRGRSGRVRSAAYSTLQGVEAKSQAGAGLGLGSKFGGPARGAGQSRTLVAAMCRGKATEKL
ncbi:hypothetical protein GLAREA_10237 [Glarea lozoyensis ATCC 20868]|uniref:Uncharacterized protein n=1 Tax=Glarea lozoyensis (strain ATCC 20868 / MF5171) TaxID=1116229 RepID=S3E880_GLAL2|nr:uncharacterized protein GLAREA_10237 [Glarea lozoyensis ATCC 20868]EPE34543.1 hypothetical protein GLAREA_10237 [Glarea lozoyensis ATCC 20868]